MHCQDVGPSFVHTKSALELESIEVNGGEKGEEGVTTVNRYRRNKHKWQVPSLEFEELRHARLG